MFYKPLETVLRGDSELISYVSTYEYKTGFSIPSIFSKSAPKGVKFDYIVITIDGTGNAGDSAVDTFNVIFDYFGWGSSSNTAIKAVKRMEKLLDRQHFEDDYWGTIRMFIEGIDTVEYPKEDRDIRTQHYNMRFSARAGRKGWAADL